MDLLPACELLTVYIVVLVVDALAVKASVAVLIVQGVAVKAREVSVLMAAAVTTV